jgi:hypothetical protein
MLRSVRSDLQRYRKSAYWPKLALRLDSDRSPQDMSSRRAISKMPLLHSVKLNTVILTNQSSIFMRPAFIAVRD